MLFIYSNGICGLLIKAEFIKFKSKYNGVSIFLLIKILLIIFELERGNIDNCVLSLSIFLLLFSFFESFVVSLFSRLSLKFIQRLL